MVKKNHSNYMNRLVNSNAPRIIGLDVPIFIRLPNGIYSYVLSINKIHPNM